MRRVYLFDVDGTLIRTGGAGHRALDRAFEAIHGAPGLMSGIRPHGKTDRAICREAFRRNLGRPDVGDVEIDRVLALYLRFLEEEVGRSESYEVIEGVVPLLERLAARGDLLGLATGNIERGARIKIGRGGLDRFFAFGGFGDDAEDRSELVRVACRRAAAIAGVPESALETYVVGDTERDVHAAREAGCIAVAVASGWTDEAELRASGADHVLRSLREADGRAPFYLAEDGRRDR